MFEKLKFAVANVESAVASGNAQKISGEIEKECLLRDAKDVMADWLDSSLGSTVKDNNIFADLPR